MTGGMSAELGGKFCAALGIDASKVTRIVLTIDPNDDPPKLEVTMTDFDGDTLVDIVHTYFVATLEETSG